MYQIRLQGSNAVLATCDTYAAAVRIRDEYQSQGFRAYVKRDRLFGR